MGFLKSKQYDALDEAGKTWTNTVTKKNHLQKAQECMENNDTLRMAWILKRHFYDAEKLDVLCKVGLQKKSFEAVKTTLEMSGSALSQWVSAYIDRWRRDILLPIMAAVTEERESEHWSYFYDNWHGYLNKENTFINVFKSGWLDKTLELLNKDNNFDAGLYRCALENWPGNEESFGKLLAEKEKVSLAERFEILNHILYKAVVDNNGPRARSIIAAGGDAGHICTGKEFGCLWLAAFNESPTMVDILVSAREDRAKEIIPYIVAEMRVQKPYSPMIADLEGYIGVAKKNAPAVETREEQPAEKEIRPDGYSLADAETLMHRQALPGTDIVLTSVFNFRTRQQTMVTDVAGKISSETKSFDAAMNDDAIESLREKFKECGGKPEHFDVIVKKAIVPALPPMGGVHGAA